jgi:hypothetical protein
MSTLRPLLKWIAGFCLVAFFLPYLEHRTFNGVSETKFTMGVQFSPWFTASWKKSEVKTEKNEDGTIRSVTDGGFSSSVNAEFFSWSCLFGIAGFGLLEVARRARPKIDSAPQTAIDATD